jgi:hypothetical protein
MSDDDTSNATAMTSGMEQTQNAIDYINTSVLQPDVTKIEETAAPMIDQATAMMVQDLQIFLKGFEQVALVGLARLADNFLTTGTYFNPASGLTAQTAEPSEENKEQVSGGKSLVPTQGKSSENPFKELFSIVGDYGKMKAEISSMANGTHGGNNTPSVPDTEASSEKKNEDESDKEEDVNAAEKPEAENIFEPLHTKNDDDESEHIEDDDNIASEKQEKDTPPKKKHWFSRKK